MKTKAITLRLPTEQIRRLQQIARQKANQEGRDINYLDLIRDTISEAYPAPRNHAALGLVMCGTE